MSDPVVDKIQNHPKYKELRAKRNGFGWFLAVLMLIVYYGLNIEPELLDKGVINEFE